MELEPLCQMRLRYEGGVEMIRPYGGEEGTAYGTGDGRVEGERLSGDVRWVNHPHRRSDGAMMPDCHGTITTDDGALLMFSMTGRTIWFDDGGSGAQVLPLTMETEDGRFRWLNDLVCLVEGVIDPEKLEMQASVYICRHGALA
jgi:hypothetical protein